MVDEPGNLAAAFDLNYSELPNSCVRAKLGFFINAWGAETLCRG